MCEMWINYISCCRSILVSIFWTFTATFIRVSEVEVTMMKLLNDDVDNTMIVIAYVGTT